MLLDVAVDGVARFFADPLAAPASVDPRLPAAGDTTSILENLTVFLD
jgi:hypothetical protein